MHGTSSNQAQRILLQTTIPYAEDDWHIARFSLLADELRRDGHTVTARNREPAANGDDPVLTSLGSGDFDQVWLFGVDAGNGITPAECEALGAFRRAGGGIFATRDHMDLGSSLCNLGGIGAAHHFHTKNQDPDPAYRANDDTITTAIEWPNFHSGSNGDVQRIAAAAPLHPVLRRSDGSAIERIPAHPHEGDVSAPQDDATARVVATGTSAASGRRFNIAVAFEPTDGKAGRGWAESTFHHFADYNLEPAAGAPSFVTEAPGDGFAHEPTALAETYRYFENLARWLAPGS